MGVLESVEQSVARENVDTKGFCGGGGGAASVTGADQYRVAMETAGTDRVARCCCSRRRVRPLNFDNLARSTNRKSAEKTTSWSDCLLNLNKTTSQRRFILVLIVKLKLKTSIDKEIVKIRFDPTGGAAWDKRSSTVCKLWLGNS